MISSIRDASWYDTGNLTAPVVVLWPDPEQQWSSVIAILQENMPELMVLGEHEPEKRTGPAIAPLMEYQYTGTLWTHRNGKEWTVNGFLQNKEEGLGLRIDQDNTISLPVYQGGNSSKP